MTVDYSTHHLGKVVAWSVPVIALISIAFGVLLYVVLMEKQLHSDAVALKQAQLVEHAEKAAEQQRDLNEYLAHEVRMMAQLCAFVNYAVSSIVYQPSKICLSIRPCLPMHHTGSKSVIGIDLGFNVCRLYYRRTGTAGAVVTICCR